jgi:hypothetical protein
MSQPATIPSGEIGFYFLFRGSVIATLSQSPLEGHDNGTLIVPRFNPYEEISLSSDLDDGRFEVCIRPSLTPNGSVVYRRTTKAFVVFHNEPFTDDILKELCRRFGISPESIQHEGIDGNPW